MHLNFVQSAREWFSDAGSDLACYTDIKMFLMSPTKVWQQPFFLTFTDSH